MADERAAAKKSMAGIRTTSFPTIANAPLPAEGNGSFSNIHLAALVLGIPYFLKRILPLVNRGGFYTYWFLVLLTGVPVTIAYWTLMSMYGGTESASVGVMRSGEPAGLGHCLLR